MRGFPLNCVTPEEYKNYNDGAARPKTFNDIITCFVSFNTRTDGQTDGQTLADG